MPWMFGNSPKNWDDYDVAKDRSRDRWFLSRHLNDVQPGDFFALWYHPLGSFTHAGVCLTRPNGERMIQLRMLELAHPVRQALLDHHPAWANSKPFTRNPDGTPNPQFAQPVGLSDEQWRTIWERLAKQDQEVLGEWQAWAK